MAIQSNRETWLDDIAATPFMVRVLPPRTMEEYVSTSEQSTAEYVVELAHQRLQLLRKAALQRLGLAPAHGREALTSKIGRASCRERV